MNKAYIFAPLLAVVAFFAYYYSFRSEYYQKIEDKKVAEEQARIAKKEKDRHDRQLAIEAAVEANTRRKAEREAKAAKEKKEKEDREAAMEYRNKQRAEQFKLGGQADRLAREVAELKEEVSKIELSIKTLSAEKEFVKEYAKKAQANAAAVQATAQKIQTADEGIKRSLKELTTLKGNKS